MIVKLMNVQVEVIFFFQNKAHPKDNNNFSDSKKFIKN